MFDQFAKAAIPEARFVPLPPVQVAVFVEFAKTLKPCVKQETTGGHGEEGACGRKRGLDTFAPAQNVGTLADLDSLTGQARSDRSSRGDTQGIEGLTASFMPP